MDLLEMQDMDYADSPYSDIFNCTYPPIDELKAAPCSVSILGLSSVGLMVTYIIVFVLSVLGNGVVIYVVCCMARGRTTTDIYLMHLAMADLLFSLTLPFWAVYVYSHWIFGTFLCKFLSGLQDAAFYSGVFLLACISVDRYLAIVKTTQALAQRRHLVGIVCGAVWLGAGLLSLPAVLQREAIQLEDLGDQSICYENLTASSSNQWRVFVRVLRHTLGFFLPLAVMVVCYSCTAATMFRGMRNGDHKHKAMRVILAVVLAFVMCWLPCNVSVLVDTLMRSGSLGEETCEFRNSVSVALYVTKVIAFTHCAVNPVLYAFIGQKFRNQFLLTLHKHELISKRVLAAYRRGSAHSTVSQRSRNTSVSL
ncbi:C-X-C chemokine receptor type 1 isoform X1 [Salmo salar]|uniref:C-X-C chemokine receptor type 1 isoform X1 n=2 Tax=Salmo salar TaxID=8030 RepID=A0A1S3PQH1_SALSA|nr:C-X-C chemokine receptor type 1-like isoform X1 [Salmo salar]|eukprot:XP_014029945.1 PREDICTED: C-X-C chemokine receptor type 1-like isoform X1 [Salmo salar]